MGTDKQANHGAVSSFAAGLAIAELNLTDTLGRIHSFRQFSYRKGTQRAACSASRDE